MSTVLIMVVAVIAVLAGGFVLGHRRGRLRGVGHAGLTGSHHLDSAGSITPDASAPAIAPDELMLVPLPNRRNEALVLGNRSALAELDAEYMPKVSGTSAPGGLPQLVRSALATGGAEATRRAQLGIDSGRIVALSEETMKHLRNGKPVYDKSKNMLGLIKGDRGKIKHVMRLDKAGAQAVVASNAATLAMTAAVSQQLAAIEEKLADIAKTLGTFTHEADLDRLSQIESANEALVEIVDNIRERGVDETDVGQLNAMDHRVRTNQRMAEHKFRELLNQDVDELNRSDRIKLLKRLAEDERLEYWLAIRVQADLARTRLDVLRLHWEIHQHPAHAREVTERVRRSIEARQARLAKIGEALREACDPRSRTRLDPLRQLSRVRLAKENERMAELLESHGEAFVTPEQHPFAVIEGTPTDAVEA